MDIRLRPAGSRGFQLERPAGAPIGLNGGQTLARLISRFTGS
jgi:hypothetical protein